MNNREKIISYIDEREKKFFKLLHEKDCDCEMSLAFNMILDEYYSLRMWAIRNIVDSNSDTDYNNDIPLLRIIYILRNEL